MKSVALFIALLTAYPALANEIGHRQVTLLTNSPAFVRCQAACDNSGSRLTWMTEHETRQGLIVGLFENRQTHLTRLATLRLNQSGEVQSLQINADGDPVWIIEQSNDTG